VHGRRLRGLIVQGNADPVGDQRRQVRGHAGRAGPHQGPGSAISGGAGSETAGLGPRP
jgi:hypothetical protein